MKFGKQTSPKAKFRVSAAHAITMTRQHANEHHVWLFVFLKNIGLSIKAISTQDYQNLGFGLSQVGREREEKAADCICETAEANLLQLFNIVTPTIYFLAIARQTFTGFTRRPHLRAFMQKVKAIKASGSAHMILCTCTARAVPMASEISLFTCIRWAMQRVLFSQPCCSIGNQMFLSFILFYFLFSVGSRLPTLKYDQKAKDTFLMFLCTAPLRLRFLCLSFFKNEQ